MRITENASLLPFNTFGIDVRARRLIEYDNPSELKELYDSGELTGRLLNVGQGSNLLFDGDFDGTVLHSRDRSLTLIPADGGKVLFKAAAGWVMDDLIALAVEKGLGGLENLSGIPGEAGSSAVQNVGAYGVEAADRIVCVDAFDSIDGRSRTFTAEECCFAYRDSLFKRPDMKRWIITSVTFELTTVPEPVLTYRGLAEALESREATPGAVREAVLALRAGKLPAPDVMGSAGSFFTNPVVERSKAERLIADYPSMPAYKLADGRVKLSAGWLIDRAGWKGAVRGRAGVYDRNALVLVNLGGVTGGEVVALADEIIADVNAKFGIELTPEVNIFR